MNSFGRKFRVEIFGESHNKAVGVLIDGMPCGIFIKEDLFADAMNKRNPAITGTTSRKEPDNVEIISGIYNNFTTGTPILLYIANKNHNPEEYEKQKMHFRPGHSDFTVYNKYQGYADLRGGGHSSGRITAGLVAAGELARLIIKEIDIKAKIEEIGGEIDYKEILDLTISSKDSLGGIVSCRVKNLPIGLGEPFFDSIESVISHLMFSIPGVKGIEFGIGFNSAKMKGSQFNDIIISKDGRTQTNNSGGINGGITNGNELNFKIALRPTSSIGIPQETFNFEKNELDILEINGRHDVCFALRVPPIVEALTAIAIADFLMISK